MASALARGFGEPVLVADVVPEKAQALASELGGEALESNSEVAQRADVLLLAHKPAQLDDVAHSTHGNAKAIASILGGTPIASVERAYPEVPVYRFLPSIPAEVRQGVTCYTPGTHAANGPESELVELFERVGPVLRLDESLIDPAMALMSCGPAFYALVVEAMETMAGAAAVLQEHEHDTAALRRRVTSPGGSTARGLEALERGGVRAAFYDAIDAVVNR
jgi:pyrroline-5-carboxylate reductase